MTVATERVVIGCGSSGATYHLPQALEVMSVPDVEYVGFDLCAERTLAQAQTRRLADPKSGYWPELEHDMRALLPVVRERGVRIMGSWGQANPTAAGERVVAVARQLGLQGLTVATLEGDDVTDLVRRLDPPVMNGGGMRISECPGTLTSANAYLGARGIVEALEGGADVVVTGRCTDASLFIAPLVHHFGWSWDDYQRLGGGMVVAHLLECGVQVTGGNFWDEPRRPVPGLDHLGDPLAEVDADGNCEIFIADSAGGLVTELTCKKQLIHEIHDPARYLNPDVTADFRNVRVEQAGNRVRVTGGVGTAPPDTLKVLVARDMGVIAEADAGYAGPRALTRARKAAEIVQTRMAGVLEGADDVRIDIIGVDSIFGAATPSPTTEPSEVRLRVAVRTADPELVTALRREFEYQWLAISGVSGVRFMTRPALGMFNALLPADQVPHAVEMVRV
jgi:hypothetical protein